VDPGPAAAFETLRTNAEMVAERERIAPYREIEPHKTIAFIAEMDFGEPEGPVVYTCPMHPDVVSDEQGRCPECGMKLMPTAAATTFTCPMHPQVVSDTPGKCPECGSKLMPSSMVPKPSDPGGEPAHDGAGHAHAHSHGGAGGIEWEDDMVEVNRTTTPANTRWKLVDRSTGAENREIEWQFRVGDQVKIRLVNEMDSDHPMHHPFHIHGAGRFLVLSRDGVEDPNLVWTDTVLVRTGEVIDILLDVTHPGRWMAHCHIAEHHESGMMFSFDVVPRGDEAALSS
jgi:FtsP/CotA-like multicopper oxidase with cupredoxin domain